MFGRHAEVHSEGDHVMHLDFQTGDIHFMCRDQRSNLSTRIKRRFMRKTTVPSRYDNSRMPVMLGL
jgi:hypothetical protein